MSDGLNVKNLILIPAIVTLVVSIMRLVGELNGGPEILFGSAAGGGMSLVGIVWLVPIFGVYFAWKLTKTGYPATSPGRLIALSLVAFVAVMAFAAVATMAFPDAALITVVVMGILSLAIMFLTKSSWPELFQTLLTYAIWARIPVIIIMFFAILGDWGTHYDSPPPSMEGLSWFVEWIMTGVIPQATVWVYFTVVVGGLFGGITALIVKK